MLISFPETAKPPYERFYEANYDRVLRYVRGKISAYEDAEDLTAEVFLYCYQHYDDYDLQKSAITTWLYLIVNSRIKNYYRDHVPSADFEEICDTLQDLGIDLERGVYLEQLHDALLAALERLPERQRRIVWLRYFENLPGEEIARQLGITPGNVRVLLSRALDRLSADKSGNWKEYTYHG